MAPSSSSMKAAKTDVAPGRGGVVPCRSLVGDLMVGGSGESSRSSAFRSLHGGGAAGQAKLAIVGGKALQALLKFVTQVAPRALKLMKAEFGFNPADGEREVTVGQRGTPRLHTTFSCTHREPCCVGPCCVLRRRDSYLEMHTCTHASPHRRAAKALL